MARVVGGRKVNQFSRSSWDGPWPCERCGNLAQYAECRTDINTIFCKYCGFHRIIDKVHKRIVEDDGTHLIYDNNGNKRRVRA